MSDIAKINFGIASDAPPLCPGCNRRHPEQVAPCPVCDRVFKFAVIGELGIWDGLAIREEDDEEANGYATYVACACGFSGPSRTTCQEAVIAWNRNVALVRGRFEQANPIQFKEAA